MEGIRVIANNYLRGRRDLVRTALGTITLLQDTFPDYQKTFVINVL